MSGTTLGSPPAPPRGSWYPQSGRSDAWYPRPGVGDVTVVGGARGDFIMRDFADFGLFWDVLKFFGTSAAPITYRKTAKLKRKTGRVVF